MKKPEEAGLTCHSTRLELQAHLTSFVFLATVHITNIRAKSYLPLSFLSTVIWPWPLFKSRQFCCITSIVFASAEDLKIFFGQSNLYRA